MAHAAPWAEVAPAVLRPSADHPFVALAAHRAAFERKWCVPALTGGLPWACTWKGALRAFPEEPSHSNQGLRYSRRPLGVERHLALPAHRAGPDAYVTAHHLRDALALHGLDELLAWERAPALLARVPFGTMRGRRWSEVDDGFLDWALGRDLDADMRFTAGHEKERRASAAGAAAPVPGEAVEGTIRDAPLDADAPASTPAAASSALAPPATTVSAQWALPL